MVSTAPARIATKEDRARIRIEWTDGHETTYSAADLRRLCPCAGCVHELTGQRLLDPATVPDDLEHQEVTLVGNYAIALRFSDGHSTGIYPFVFLRENDPGPA